MRSLREFFIDSPDDWLVYLLGLQMVFCFYTVAMSSIAGGLLVTAALLSSAKNRLGGLLKRKELIPVFLILIWLPITLLWSKNFQSGVSELRNLWFYLLILIGYLIDWDERRFKIVLSMFLFGAASNFFIGLLQMVGLWPLGGYDPVQGPVGYSYRVFLGVDTVPLIIFMVWDFKNRYFFKNRVTPLLIASFLTIQLAMTTGRTGQALFAILFIPSLFLIFNRQKRLLSLLLLIFFVFLVLVAFTVPSVELRWHDALRDVSMFFSGEPVTDVGLRMVFWDSAYHIFMDHPIVGIGPGSFVSDTIENIQNGVIPKIPSYCYVEIEPHNSFLAYLTSYGLVGLILFILFLYGQAKRSWESRKFGWGFFRLLMLSAFVVGSFSDVMIFRFAVAAPFMVAMSIYMTSKLEADG